MKDIDRNVFFWNNTFHTFVFRRWIVSEWQAQCTQQQLCSFDLHLDWTVDTLRVRPVGQYTRYIATWLKRVITLKDSSRSMLRSTLEANVQRNFMEHCILNFQRARIFWCNTFLRLSVARHYSALFAWNRRGGESAPWYKLPLNGFPSFWEKLLQTRCRCQSKKRLWWVPSSLLTWRIWTIVSLLNSDETASDERKMCLEWGHFDHWHCIVKNSLFRNTALNYSPFAAQKFDPLLVKIRRRKGVPLNGTPPNASNNFRLFYGSWAHQSWNWDNVSFSDLTSTWGAGNFFLSSTVLPYL